MTIKTPFHSSGCALIIGINDYPARAASEQLEGSVNDAAAVARLCLALGMNQDDDRDDVHVVSSEVDGESPDQLKVNRNKDTTRSGIVAEIGWLRGQLEAGRKGLLWYSGHGAHNEKGLLLCPSDTTADLSNTLPFRELRGLLGEKAVQNLTVVLDCCHSGSVTDHLGRTSTTLGGAPILKDIADEMEIGAVVLTACAPEEQSQQAQFASHWHGAFTWALLSVIDQWKKVQHASNVHLTMSYRQLLKKAMVLLDGLEFEGTPQIYPRAAGGLAVLQQGYEAEVMTDQPDAERPWIQMDTGDKQYALYTLEQTIGQVTTKHAQVLVVKDKHDRIIKGITYKGQTEHWSIKGTAPTAGTAIAVSCTTGDWSNPPDLPGGFPLDGAVSTMTTSSAATWGTSTSTLPSAVWQVGNYYMSWSSKGPEWWSNASNPSGSIVTTGTTSLSAVQTAPTGSSFKKVSNAYASLSPAGKWSWFDGHEVQLKSDGTGSEPDFTCTWTARNTQVVTIQWKQNGVDKNKDMLTLSDDGLTLNGWSSDGQVVSGTWTGPV